MRVESTLWRRIKAIQPRAERIENSISSGLPDVLYPAPRCGWILLELKLLRGKSLFFQKYQMSFYAKTVSYSWRQRPLILVEEPGGLSLCFAEAVLAMEREPYKDKVKVRWETQGALFDVGYLDLAISDLLR